MFGLWTHFCLLIVILKFQSGWSGILIFWVKYDSHCSDVWKRKIPKAETETAFLGFSLSFCPSGFHIWFRWWITFLNVLGFLSSGWFFSIVRSFQRKKLSLTFSIFCFCHIRPNSFQAQTDSSECAFTLFLHYFSHYEKKAVWVMDWKEAAELNNEPESTKPCIYCRCLYGKKLLFQTFLGFFVFKKIISYS